ncbi:hypothetical protein [Streptomyces diastaticus]|uniref:hypothetical protein n=1 Tax=Streptomyces diastaticus TaxID=1956 RepID=UPI0035D7F472
MTATGRRARVPRRLVALVALPFVAASALAAGVQAAASDRLPARLAVHFGAGGGTGSRARRSSWSPWPRCCCSVVRPGPCWS